MTFKWIATKPGSPESIQKVEFQLPALMPSEVRIQSRFIGLNFVDIQHIAGTPYPVDFPRVPGIEAVGEIIALGENAKQFEIGDLVAFHGRYQTKQNVPESDCVLVPAGLSAETAAAVFLQGTTAVALWKTPTRANIPKSVLINSVTGGVSSLLAQLFKSEGFKVFGTVNNVQKIKHAEKLCDSLYVAKNTNRTIPEWIAAETSDLGVGIAYDSGGAKSTEAALAALAKRAELIIFGHSDGSSFSIDSIRLSGLTSNNFRGSNAVRWIASSHWKETQSEYVSLVSETFDLALKKTIVPIEISIYKFDEARNGLTQLANRSAIGKSLLSCE